MALRADLQVRLMECGLETHPTKGKIVYCKDSNRRSEYPNVSFDFLGYRFQPRRAESTRSKQVFCNFSPSGQPVSVEVYAIGDSGLGHPPKNPGVAGRHRP
jgi:RNA-directed DNA polymerase